MNTSRQTLPLRDHADLVIIGGGIMGLWAAYHAEKSGIDTVLIDSSGFARGASSGLLGVLMAYMPDQWDGKKQFQFEALIELEAMVRSLETETGLSIGYRRSGRVMPLFSERQLMTARSRQNDAALNWRHGVRQFNWTVVDKPPIAGWPAANAEALAYVYEDLAAHVFPRDLIAALVSFLKGASHVRLVEGVVVEAIDAQHNFLHLLGGETIGYSKAIVSAGVAAFELLQPLWAPEGKPLGRPVKGQAALLQADCNFEVPIFFDNGLYVVAHPGGQVAIGSTSEDEFDADFDTDDKLDALIAAARERVPALKYAPVVERWAGLRPRGVHREPMIGAIDNYPDVIALGGGFKTSFGIAHRLARHAVQLTQEGVSLSEILPNSFDVQIYLKRAQ